jgi:O-antigen ligase
MTFTLTRDEDRANRLLTAWIAIGAFYAIYAFAISLFGTEQFRIFYSLDPVLKILSGPFVQRNSFATYEGLAALAAIARLFELGQGKILASKGARRLALTALKFVLGSGVFILIAAALSVSALIASASRGGFASTLSALVIMALIGAALPRRKRNWKMLLAAGASVFLLIGILAWISGGALSAHFLDLADVPNGENLRKTLWGASERMISSAPFLGLGLGTFQDAYPMYATQVFPYIMDKAHNDYLEFAAGLGLPAAICWWAALLWLAGKFLRAVFTRKKDRIYPLLGVGATVLVAVHSLVDFSLQMPAVAVTYAALLGLALAQSFSSKTVAA